MAVGKKDISTWAMKNSVDAGYHCQLPMCQYEEKCSQLNCKMFDRPPPTSKMDAIKKCWEGLPVWVYFLNLCGSIKYTKSRIWP